MIKKLKYRLFNKIYAWLFNYFWKPCPICNKYFGGHETGDATVFSNSSGLSGWCACKEHRLEESYYIENGIKHHPIRIINGVRIYDREI